MKRNYINEITAIKARLEFDSRHAFSSRLSDIEKAFRENLSSDSEFNEELLKYIPIATVACFESFFRSVIKELIDFGKPYSDNAVKFNQSKNVKFDFDIVNAIQSKTVTVGEFVSHILPCNSYEDINSNLSTLADIDFTKSIKTFERTSIFDHVNDNTRIFIANFDQIISDIKRTFELRHIFCHEFATNVKIDKKEILRCFTNSKIFLNQTNEFILDLLYPNAPETQMGMNQQASEFYGEAEIELANFILKIKEVANGDSDMHLNISLFDQSIAQWKEYREIKAKLDASPVQGGSMYPLLYASSLSGTTNEKIESLQKDYEFYLRKNANCCDR